ncbi:hypothetical protein GEMRC1_003036 [Eukaryota sp. GEM-RC1]
MSLPEINHYKDNENVESAIESVWTALNTAVRGRYIHESCRTLLKFVVDFAFADFQSPLNDSFQLPSIQIMMFHKGCLRITDGEPLKFLKVTHDVMEQIKNQLVKYCKELISEDNATIPYHVAVKCCDLLHLHYGVNQLSTHFDPSEMNFLLTSTNRRTFRVD